MGKKLKFEVLPPVKVSQVALEINKLHEGITALAKRALGDAIKIGELLTQQKAKLKHGGWLPWVKGNLKFSYKTAERYMNLWERKDELDSESNLNDALRRLTKPKDPEEVKRAYSRKLTAPIYKPSGKKPNVSDLVDKTKSTQLIKKINESGVSSEEKAFLIDAAERHNVFHYNLIADYYAHSEKEMQRLMEESALVIIDFDHALEYGYVKYTKEIAEIYAKEHGKSFSEDPA
jgi:hypothetical protein